MFSSQVPIKKIITLITVIGNGVFCTLAAVEGVIRLKEVIAIGTVHIYFRHRVIFTLLFFFHFLTPQVFCDFIN